MRERKLDFGAVPSELRLLSIAHSLNTQIGEKDLHRRTSAELGHKKTVLTIGQSGTAQTHVLGTPLLLPELSETTRSHV